MTGLHQPDDLLRRLGDRLARRGRHVDLVVLGASALAADRLIDRSTYDVDVLALLRHGRLVAPVPLPEQVGKAQAQIMQELGLTIDFLDIGVPEYILALGVPDGLVSRLQRRDFGPSLTVHLVSRFDQIHLKCLAMVAADDEAGKHAADLRALDPSPAEQLAAVDWSQNLLCKRVQRDLMILQEQLLRDGRRSPELLRLTATRLGPVSRRYRVGGWLLKAPTWCGRAFAALTRLGGHLRRRRQSRGSQARARREGLSRRTA